MTEYDDEFGPNRVDRCGECNEALAPEQVCWCLDGGEND